MESPAISTSAEFKDRSISLKVIGIFEVLLGFAAIGMGLLASIGTMLESQVGNQTNLAKAVPGLFFYLLFAICFFCLGIGSYQAKRWARALSLIVSASWLVIGIFSFIFMVILFPKVLAAAESQGGPLAPAVKVAMMIFVFSMLFVIYLLIPAILFFFYRSAHVKATCESRDPVTRWTDRCPLPVLGMSLWLVYAALTAPVTGLAYNGIIPAFGFLLSGWKGVLCHFLISILCFYLAWSLYRLRKIAWWLVLFTSLLGTLSIWLTFSKVSFLEAFKQMGSTAEQIQIVQKLGIFEGPWVILYASAAMLPWFGYLIFIRRYFKHIH